MLKSLSLSFALAAVSAASMAVENINVDANANRKAIDARIYGIAFASAAQLSELNVPTNRYGGNTATRYNWKLNCDNKGQDWYFQSIAGSSAAQGEYGDSFITSTRSGGAQPMLTIPMIGWVARVNSDRQKLCSYSQAKYGAQTDADWNWFPDAGNGILASNNQPITTNDKNEANVAADSTFQQDWVKYLVGKWGTSANGGLKYYFLDNEYSIWHSTHRDVHPTGANMDEIRDKMIDYGTKIKAVDANAIVLGPEEWGWSGYIFSGYDQWWGAKNGWSNLPDRAAHGGMDYMPWLLGQLKANNDSTGKRLLDVFTLHYYPQGGEFGNDTSSSMQQRRNRSTRSLWDPNYVDETWVNEKVQLIPRMKSWVNTYYPNTAIGITEYNWGAEGHINGATAQADVLGIFGREGLTLANRWTTPDAASVTYNAMKMYRNYDGNKSTFGDTSVAAGVTNPDNLSAFAAERSSDGAMTVMVINKITSSTSISVNLSNFTPGAASQVWQLTSSNTINHLADISVVAGKVTATVPAQSITLFIITAGAAPQPPAAPTNLSATATSSSQINLSWTDTANETGYKLERKTGAGGTYAQIAAPAANATSYSDTGLSASTQYFYRIRANNAAGDSAFSAEANATTQSAPQPPAAPTNLSATATSSSQINLSWTDTANETGYKLERKTGAVGTYAQIATPAANATSYSDIGLSASTQYFYRIRANNAAGDSAFSAEANASTQTPPINPPATVQFTMPADNTTASGVLAINVLAYDSSVGTTDGAGIQNVLFELLANNVVVDSHSENFASYDWNLDTTLHADATYTVRATATSTTAAGGGSTTVLISIVIVNTVAPPPPTPTVPNAPGGLVAVAQSENQIALSWMDNSSDETGFEIEHSSDGVIFTPLATLPFNSQSFMDTGLIEALTFYYRVRAINAAGNSNYSETASATTFSSGGASQTSGDVDGDGIADAFDADADGDGVSNSNELADGTDPLSASSFKLLECAVLKLKVTAKFSSPNSDSASLKGVLHMLPAGWSPTGQSLVLDIGGAQTIFNLDANCRGKNSNGQFALKLKGKRDRATRQVVFAGGDGAFSARLTKGSWLSAWSDEGINPNVGSKNQPAAINVQLVLDGRRYGASVQALYSARANVSGTLFKK